MCGVMVVCLCSSTALTPQTGACQGGCSIKVYCGPRVCLICPALHQELYGEYDHLQDLHHTTERETLNDCRGELPAQNL